MAALRRAAAIAAMAPKKRGGAHRVNTQIEKWEGSIAGGELPSSYNTLRFTFLPANHRLTLHLMCVNEAGAEEGAKEVVMDRRVPVARRGEVVREQI